MTIYIDPDFGFDDWLDEAVAKNTNNSTFALYRRGERNWIGVVADARAAFSTMLELYDFADAEGNDPVFRRLLDELATQFCVTSVEDVPAGLKLKM